MSEDLRSPDAIRAAFARLRPQRDATPAGQPPSPTPQAMEELKRFGLFVRGAVDSLLGAEAAEVPRAFTSWSPEQRALLEEIAKTPYELHLNAGDLGRILQNKGAIGPGGVDDDRYLARYAGLRDPSALEKEVDGRPLWLGLRLHLMGKVSAEDWLKATSGLDSAERRDLARRALDNAYQLMRRWPLPADITKEVEREDAARLQTALAPVLGAVSADELGAALARELDAPTVVPELIVLLCFLLAPHGAALPARADERLAAALRLQTTTILGRQLLALLPPERRLAIVERIALTPYNMNGWPYLDLLEPAPRIELVAKALKSFKQPCKPEVAARVAELIEGLDASSREPLREVAAQNGPNAKLIENALNKLS